MASIVLVKQWRGRASLEKLGIYQRVIPIVPRKDLILEAVFGTGYIAILAARSRRINSILPI